MESNVNDHERIEESLSQCLAQSKRPLGLLLGAGCPASIQVPDDGGEQKPLIPDIAGLTSMVNRSLEESHPKYQELLVRLTDDLERPPNIEEVLSHVRGLAQIVGKHQVHNLNKSEIDGLERNITDEITKAVSVNLPTDHGPYDDLAIWAHAVTRDIPIRIFTTNYDLLLETAFERKGVPFFDGFAGAKEPFLDSAAIEEDDLPPRWTRLIKLHGSSNWVMRDDQRVVRVNAGDGDERRLIHPSHLKYTESRRMPYLAMFDQLRDFLKNQSATLITVGYSFNDDHINDLLCQGLRGNASAKIFGLMYKELKKYTSAVAIAEQHLGLSLLAGDGGIDAGKVFMQEHDEDGVSQISQLGDFQHFGQRLRRTVGGTDQRPEDQDDSTPEADDG